MCQSFCEVLRTVPSIYQFQYMLTSIPLDKSFHLSESHSLQQSNGENNKPTSET